MNNTYLVEERARDIGQFMVGRLLPFRRKRQVGPFTFIDHMGPAQLGPDKYMDVDQHPHIGLSTLTYLLEGAVEHRDSTGAVQVISPGDVGFMTAGEAVTHTERTPQSMRNGSTFTMHGYQIWVALPKSMEHGKPSFQYIAKDDLPRCHHQNFNITVVAGKAFGLESPLEVYSPLFMVDIEGNQGGQLKLNGEVTGEIAVVVVSGKVEADGEHLGVGQMLISTKENQCPITLEPNSRVLLFGGQALPEERHLYWNFVASSKERLQEAKAQWDNKEFPVVPGDTTYIPAPKMR